MGRHFDPIDIVFIILILTYFAVLFSIIFLLRKEHNKDTFKLPKLKPEYTSKTQKKNIFANFINIIKQKSISISKEKVPIEPVIVPEEKPIEEPMVVVPEVKPKKEVKKKVPTKKKTTTKKSPTKKKSSNSTNKKSTKKKTTTKKKNTTKKNSSTKKNTKQTKK